MIHKRMKYGDDGWMGVADAENYDKYRSYIQRRRVVEPSAAGDSLIHGLVEKKESAPKTESIFSEDTDKLYSHKTGIDEDSSQMGQSEEVADSYRGYSAYDRSFNNSWTSAGTYDRPNAAQSLKRTDTGLYKRLYGNRRSGYQSGISSYRSSSTSGYTTEITDNHTTVLAIKIIKQSLACFAILGIVVLMQQRDEMAEALSFVKKHVVDTHWDPQNLITGVENIIKACSRLLGGSP